MPVRRLLPQAFEWRPVAVYGLCRCSTRLDLTCSRRPCSAYAMWTTSPTQPTKLARYLAPPSRPQYALARTVLPASHCQPLPKVEYSEYHLFREVPKQSAGLACLRVEHARAT